MKTRGLLVFWFVFAWPPPSLAGPFSPSNDPQSSDLWRFKTSWAYAEQLHELDLKIEQHRLLNALDAAERQIDNRSPCQPLVVSITELRSEIRSMDASYQRQYSRHKTTSTEPQEIAARDALLRSREEKKRRHDAKWDEYEACFSQQLRASQNWEKFTAYQVTDKESFDHHRNTLREHTNASKTTIEEIEEEQRRILAMPQVGIIAKITSTSGQVEVREATWDKAHAGKRLRLEHEVRTGPQSRARIQFLDRDASNDAGPTIVNVGENTHIRIKDFGFTIGDHGASRGGTIELLRGKFRGFMKNWLGESEFGLKSSATLCGIRGPDTDIEIEYKPAIDRVSYRVYSGDAHIITPTGRRQLRPGQTVVVDGGRISDRPPT